MDTQNDLFQPNLLLAGQFADALRSRGAFVEGEKRLLAAVLDDAVDCYMKHCGATQTRQRQLFEEAEGWIFDDSRGELFTFATVCEILGFEPDYIRRGLLEWRRRHHPESLAA